MKPRHDTYPVEVGKAPSLILSNFLIGYPAVTPLQVKYHQPTTLGESSSIEAEYYVSIPPEFPHKEFEEKVSAAAVENAKRAGCEASLSVVYEEEPFQQDAKSVLVRATTNVFQKLTGFEPVVEWLPYPVSGKILTSSGFAKDVMVLGPGDWTMTNAQDEKSTLIEAFRASEILAEIPYEVASLVETVHMG
jgi:acetylornithine deacetylase/succinyl-diaminopimelate desuccinylase-like protein